MKTFYLSLGLLSLVWLAAGCDNISEDDRYIKVEKPVIDNPRNLLIMEFTGNSCSNCPTGAAVVEQIKEDEAPGRVISVGLHPDGVPFTEPLPSLHDPKRQQDFRCQAATALYDYYKPDGFPAALFNGLSSSLSGSTSDWMTRAKDALKATSYVNLSAVCRYDAQSRELSVDYDAQFLDYFNTQLNVTVWLVENKIMGTQVMPDGNRNFFYEHNHVLRASLNGDWGTAIGNSFADGDSVNGHASMKINEDWVAENCDVVVYVYRDENKEVEQSVSIGYDLWLADFPISE